MSRLCHNQEGAKLLGRWTQVDFSKGYDLVESDDPSTLAEFALSWNDLMHIDIVPVLEDAQVAELLKRRTT